MKNEKISFSGRIDRLTEIFGKKKDLEVRLAEVGISRSTLHRLEQGQQKIKADHLEKLSIIEKERGLTESSFDPIIASILKSRLLTLVSSYKTWGAVSELIGMSAEDCFELLKKKTLPPECVTQIIALKTEDIWSNEEQIKQAVDHLAEMDNQIEKLKQLLVKTRTSVAMIPRVEYDPLKLLIDERNKEIGSKTPHTLEK